MRRTKIVATLGPASDAPGVLGAVLDAGVDVVRLALAHGTVDEHRARVEQVRDLAERRGRTVGVLADLPGPKVRAGTFPEGGAFLAEGDEVTLVTGDGPSDDDLRLVDEIGKTADWVAVSFVRQADELVRVREALGPDGPRLMAKIETRGAVEHLEDLLAVADGVMVARGDLGIDFPIADVPHLQKQIIRACGARGLPVVTATQMLESMVTAPSPTRAEASDVANAVVDGTDALMLSAESAIGHDPALAVRTMASIAERTEQFDDQHGSYEQGLGQRRAPSAKAVTVAMAHAALRAAVELDLAAIVCCTRAGPTARAMAALRPPCRLIGASPSLATARQLALSWGVEPMLVDEYTTTDEMVWCVVEAAVGQDLVRHGDSIAVLAGAPEASPRRTDVLRVVAVA